MLPNEILDNIFKYYYYDLNKFFSRIKRVNREYHRLFYRDEKSGIFFKRTENVQSLFPYNYRQLEDLPSMAASRSIYNPNNNNIFIFPKLPKNY